MSLFIIIYVSSTVGGSVGAVGGTVGPLPYDMTECRRRAAELALELSLDADYAKARSFNITFACEQHAARPEIAKGLLP